MVEQIELGIVVRVWTVRWRPSMQRGDGHTTFYVGPLWLRTYSNT